MPRSFASPTKWLTTLSLTASSLDFLLTKPCERYHRSESLSWAQPRCSVSLFYFCLPTSFGRKSGATPADKLTDDLQPTQQQPRKLLRQKRRASGTRPANRI
jgi:hypothetical protein